jgi:hypothetical protein
MIRRKLIPLFLFISLGVGLIMRGYQIKERFLYTHDNDLSSWIIKDVIIDKHPRLIGQLTSAPGIFIGPLFYYALIPFYLLGGMDPAAGLYLSLLIGLSTIVSIYFIMTRLHNETAGKITSLLYASSELISRTEREVVPTTPVMLWSIWCYYGVNLVFRGDKKGFLIAAVLFSLVWHINLALILLAPLFVVGFFYQIRKFKITDLLLPLIVFLTLSSPLLFFEKRHDFVQTKALVSSLLSVRDKEAGRTMPQKVTHVVSYALKNANHIFLDNGSDKNLWLIPGLLIASLLILILLRKIPFYEGPVFLLWMGLFIAFFTFHPINLSEYYLNGMNIFWIIILGLLLAALFSHKYFRILALAVLTFVLSANLSSFLVSPINASGYLERKSIVDYIEKDSHAHNYPCISISYITNPGYELGYRYLFYLKGLHVNQPISGSPVYTIVYPHPLVDRLDKTFGALGLILPDYDRYSPEAVKLSCMGANSNLTDPMFGFTR